MSASSSEAASTRPPAAEFARLAEALQRAYRDRTPIDPIGPRLAAHGTDGAYAVQELQTQAALAAGRRLVGRKIGLTSRSVQQQLGVDQPDYGMLFADMEIADGEVIDPRRLLQPRVEAEIAFVMERDLDDDQVSLARVTAAVAFALPAIEVVDSRIRDWKISLTDTIADNASSGAYVLGGSPRRIDALDLRLCGMVMTHVGEPVSVGCGAACLGNPLNALLWLARRMARAGRPLAAGDVVLSGALGPMVSAQAGAVYEARIEGLGSVRAHFGTEAR
jgi:2-keto-4-pentenoate hydratase